MNVDTWKLRKYFFNLSQADQVEFATRCKTSAGHIKQIIYRNRNCNPVLAIALERESGGKIICDDLCPNADFAYLRSQASA